MAKKAQIQLKNSSLVKRIQSELLSQATPEFAVSQRKFFKEGIKLRGVRSAEVDKIAKKYFKEIKTQTKTEVFALCELLLKSGYIEDAFVAYGWANKLSNQFVPGDFKVLERWLQTYVSNWAECDTLCNHPIGSCVERYPELMPALKRWTRSPNRWVRRAAAVSLIVPAKRGKFLPDVFEIADALIADGDDLVQKGYGWLLKAAADAGDAGQEAVFAYVMKHRAEMPRVALRYAIEKMSGERKKRLML